MPPLTSHYLVSRLRIELGAFSSRRDREAIPIQAFVRHWARLLCRQDLMADDGPTVFQLWHVVQVDGWRSTRRREVPEQKRARPRLTALVDAGIT